MQWIINRVLEQFKNFKIATANKEVPIAATFEASERGPYRPAAKQAHHILITVVLVRSDLKALGEKTILAR